jgi:hypothetical protein
LITLSSENRVGNFQEKVIMVRGWNALDVFKEAQEFAERENKIVYKMIRV